VLGAIFEAARQAEKPVIVDPKRRHLAAYAGATVLTPNRRELGRASGVDCDTPEGIERAASIVHAQTGAAILVTLSEEGIEMHQPDAPVWRNGATAKRVRDVSGAGDTVAAVMGLALADGHDMVAAARLANLAAGVAVGKSGTSTLNCDELIAAEDFVKAAIERAEANQPGGKLRTLRAALSLREKWRDDGLTVGFTNGCFDLLHPGHIQVLRGAAKHCDRLIVALNTDASVRRLKGPARPVQNEQSRAAVMEALEPVDLVVMFSQDTPLHLIQTLAPDVLIKGADYREDEVVGGDIVKSYGGKVVLVEIASGHSTTDLIARSRADADAA
jgi:D-beta-D-heptose 7-phosphate kinase/D-beta-D-heptose 1-phosphate adenosyltransferase